MAVSNKIFVSPGVYTSERDLSFVSQSVGVTTLGLVGETIVGPAFEPIFITNYDEFEAFFGGTLPEKFVNTQIPKYELAYIAKSYLQQSNQLFVTRVLGLSGYDAGPSWSITTIANVDGSTVGFSSAPIPWSVEFSACTNDSSVTFLTSFPSIINNNLNLPYTQLNGSQTTLSDDIDDQLLELIANGGIDSGSTISYFGTVSDPAYTSLSPVYTAETNVFQVSGLSQSNADFTSPNNDSWYYSNFDITTGNNYTGYSFYSIVTSLDELGGSSPIVQTFTITTVPNPGSPPPNRIYQVNGSNYPVLNLVRGGVYTFDQSDPTNTTHPIAFRLSDGTTSYTDGVSSVGTAGSPGAQTVFTVPNNAPNGLIYYCITHGNGMGNTISVTSPVGSGCYSGTVSGNIYVYSGTAFNDYNNLVVATLRSRGISLFGGDNSGPIYSVSGLTDVIIDNSGIYSGISTSPYATFNISGITADGTDFAFTTSLNSSDQNYITKVFGSTNFGKPRSEVPLYVEETFQNMLNLGYNKGLIRGLNASFIGLPGLRYPNPPGNTGSIACYTEKYQSAESPYVVSELRGTTVDKLFKIISIADGDTANTQVKISIQNISFNNGTFDLGVRSFFDTDTNPVYLEKYVGCSMDPGNNSYVGVQIGTSDGEYELNSKYIMLELNITAPIDALPCGFEGYVIRNYGNAQPPYPVYKTSYNFPGEVIGNPPFNIPAGPNPIISPGDNVRRTFLGISSQIGFDPDFYLYKGKQVPTNLCVESDPLSWNYVTKGFHMDSGATVVTISTGPTASTPAFDCGDASFQSDPQNPTNPYFTIQSRKFSFLLQGGFDGWDIYRENRTNDDRFVIGGSLWQKGACPTTRYPLATGWGAFKTTTQEGFVEFSNTDYYAYLLGIYTFQNPEAVNINVFATPGIDYINNSNLVEEAVDMVTFQRADAVYIVTTPDNNVYIPTQTDNIIPPTTAVDRLDQIGLDSNYTATYYPWILVRDTVNNTQIYIPPTNEVCRNLALTDNISFPWFAAAGYTRGLVNAIKARIKLTQDERDTLYQGRINPIATFSDVGTVIFGNKTLQVANTALNRINVRRLLLQARKLISAVAVRLLFEQNDAKVRQDFLDAVNPILDGIRRDRGLFDFRVTVSSSPEDLDRNTMSGKIFLKPTRALEFIDIEFLITPTGASFENI